MFYRVYHAMNGIGTHNFSVISTDCISSCKSNYRTITTTTSPTASIWQLSTLPEHLSSSPVFSGVRNTRSVVLYVCFVDRYLSFCSFTFGHCVFCSSIYRFWLPPFDIFKLRLLGVVAFYPLQDNKTIYSSLMHFISILFPQ
jgi:hypothetical protein